MKIAYLDTFAGISGDMLLGALIDAAIPFSVLQEATAALNLNASLTIERVDRSGIAATKVHVMEGTELADQPHAHPHAHPHQPGRSLTMIRELIQSAALAEPVKILALQAFELLGAAEAKIHNVPADEVHFHEVGAVDAIVDIVAASAGVHHLQIDQWFCSAINVGGGMVQCAHGLFPVPAPATADLLRNCPTYSANIQKELVTPTGAALLRALAPQFGPQPPMQVQAIGYGAGTRNPANFPNVLRLSVGQRTEPASNTDTMTVTVLETALDDLSPQLTAYVAEQALAAGALDVMLTSVIMKKGRPGTLITILCDPDKSLALQQLLYRETTTLGVRIRQDNRSCLARSFTRVRTPYGEISIKTGSFEGTELNANPEFEDCRKAANEHQVALKLVQQAAIAAYRNGGQA